MRIFPVVLDWIGWVGLTTDLDLVYIDEDTSELQPLDEDLNLAVFVIAAEQIPELRLSGW